VKTTMTAEQLRDLMRKTDLQSLTHRMDELAEPPVSTAAAADRYQQVLRRKTSD